MKTAAHYIARLRREERELQAGVAALDSVWRLHSLRAAAAALRRMAAGAASRLR